ncbi:MAG: LCP family protein [Spirochaetaceae bacterium]|nr:LCP family protein [Spirochaetaceae bacterium]MDE0227395.1 LCP family protein [Spirochaetaceae bacterium]MDE0448215.1 LCP family protein [Spirochaetaceae bacterium]
MRVTGGRSGRRDFSYLLLLAIVALLAATAVFAATRLRTDEVSRWLEEHDLLVGLVVISDPRHRIAVEVLLIDPHTGRAGLLLIPGNVGALIASRNRMDALETIYRDGDVAPLRGKVEELLGVEPMYVLEITGDRMRDLVDLLGGVEVFVPEPVDQEDAEGRVLLPAGAVLLDGDKALEYLRYQAPDEPDVEWAARVHRLMQGALRAVGEQRRMLLHADVQRYLHQRIGNDLTQAGFATLLASLTEIDSERMIFQYTIGQPQTVDGRTLIFPHYDGALLREAVTQVVAALVSGQTDSVASANVEILNGSGVTGLARGAAPVLQSFGFRVARVANADHHGYAATEVIDRRGRLEVAQRVADLMECGTARTEPHAEADTDSEIDVTVILGGDFNGRSCTE